MTRHIVIVVALAAAACGGPDKPANSASADCPPGTQKQGGDCVAPDEESGPGQAASMEAHGKSEESGSGAGASSAMASPRSGGGGSVAPAGPKTPYDKDAVEMVLRRAANQVKANCGAATDSDGKRNGPWGATKVSVTLGRNGHVRDVSIPSPYADKPAGSCAIKAFENLIFPPYAAPADAVVDWDVELVKPK